MNHERHYNKEDCNNKNNNNTGGGGGGGGCYFHPKQVLVGVCPLCLNERLVILASKQAAHGHGHGRGLKHLPSAAAKSVHRKNQGRRRPSFPRIFALGSYFFHRLELRNWKSEDSDHDDGASTSQDDSFISIKFEDNGVGSWEKGKAPVSKVSLEHCNMTTWNHSLRKETPKRVIDHLKETKESKSVIEHAKPRASLRWRKRIGHLFQLIRWKRSSKATVCHVGSKVEGVKVRKGWIRNLTKRRTKD